MASPSATLDALPTLKILPNAEVSTISIARRAVNFLNLILMGEFPLLFWGILEILFFKAFLLANINVLREVNFNV